ncbi:MAG: DNA gyrase subunit A [Syntrophomonadaceae bacterium]|nr:DNA gyrase subunit A [Syntrophomonadaceae bacterium]
MSPDNANVIQIDIEKEVKRSFLDYSMSVIVSRALPDVRDGLKPVHRRILYALYDQGMLPDKAHRKSANLVGEVLGKYHPHGDSSVYDAMVRLAQDFSIRYPLVDGHGNFGSIDGDSAAAMRYTETRMAPIALEMLADIDKKTVDFRPNYDDSREEPSVLPSRVPNLLINGSTGIAVGMATNIPPHNLSEVINGLNLLLENPDVEISELMKEIKGPDFPTGATIIGAHGIWDAYHTGRGSIKIRGNANIEELSNGKYQILVTEIPYMVNKARLVEKIADLVREKKIEGITDLRDECDRNGIRILIEVRKDMSPQVILNQLYKHTQLQETFGVNMLALVDSVPRILNLKEMLSFYIDHRKEIIINRTRYELDVAKKRLHIVEGLKIALDNIDAVIQLIRSAANDREAREGLMTQFHLSEEQANAILDMRLRRLTGLERGKLEQEFEVLLEQIADLEDILARPERVVALIKEDLAYVKAKYGDDRRTAIVYDELNEDIEALINEETIVVNLTNGGYIKRLPLSTYRSQKRGGRGLIGAAIKVEDFATEIFVTSNLATILFFTNKGRVYSLKAYKIPEASRQAKGTPAINILDLTPEEKVTTIMAIRDFKEDQNLLMVTQKGIAKKVKISSFEHIRKSGIIAIRLQEDDELVGVRRTQAGDKIILVASNGVAIVFDEKDVRVMGRTAGGVRGISLSPGAKVVDVDKCQSGSDLVMATENGYGKRTALSQFKVQRRGGKGLKAINMSERNGLLIGAKVVVNDEEIIILSVKGIVIRLAVEDISKQGRYTRGVTLMKLDEGDRIVSIARFKSEEEELLEDHPSE